MLNRVSRWTAFALALALGAQCRPDTTPQAPLPLPLNSVFGVSAYQLHNGLEVLLYPDRRHARTTVNLVYRSGSADDPLPGSGTAHMVEHLMFRRTNHRTNILKELVEHAVQYNAATWVERTSYVSNFAADEATLAWILELEADRMSSLVIEPSEFLRERDVVANEIEAAAQDPVAMTLQDALAIAYVDHPYGRPVRGHRDELPAITLDSVKRFHSEHYGPGNATLYIGGNFDPDRALEVIQRTLGLVAKSPPPSRREVRASDAKRAAVIAVRRDSPSVSAGVLARVGPGSGTPYVAASVLVGMLSEGAASPLQQRLVRAGPAYRLVGFADGFRQDGYMFFFAEGRPGISSSELQGQLLTALQESMPQALSEAALELQKERTRSRFFQAMQDAAGADTALLDAIALGEWRTLFRQQVQVSNLSVDAIRSMSDQVGLLQGRIEPDLSPKVTASTPRPGALNAAPTSAASPSSTAPAADLKTLDQELRYLSGGDGRPRVVLWATNRSPSQVTLAFTGLCRGSPVQRRRLAAPLMSKLLGQALSMPEGASLREKLESMGGRIRSNVDEQSVWIAAELPASELPALLRRLGEVSLFGPDLESRLPAIQRDEVDGVRLGRTDPRAVAIAVAQGDGVPGVARFPDLMGQRIKDLGDLRPDEVASIWADCWSTANVGVAAVGDVDAGVAQRAEAALATWTTHGGRVVEGRFGSQSFAGGGTIVVDVPQSAYGIFLARSTFAFGEFDPDYPAAVIAAHLLGGSPSAWLFDHLRNRSGMSYSIASFLAPQPADGGCVFGIYASFSPSRRAEFEHELGSALAAVRETGFTQAQVKAAVDDIIRERRASLANTLVLSSRLALNAAAGRSAMAVAEVDKRLSQTNADEVNAALRRLLDVGRLRHVYAGDFSTPTSERSQRGSPH